MTNFPSRLLRSAALSAAILLLAGALCAPDASAQLFRRGNRRTDARERLEQSRDTLGPSASRARRRGQVLDTSARVPAHRPDSTVPPSSSEAGPVQQTSRFPVPRATDPSGRDPWRIIDSLQRVIDDYERRMAATDSLAGEILDLYEENENKIGTGLGPEDYTPTVSDSLLEQWYLRGRGARSDAGDFEEVDAVRYTSTVPDEVLLERLEKMNSFITLPYNPTVRNYMVLYSERLGAKMPRMLGDSEYYFPIFEEILSGEDMPEELKMMAVIESALNPIAVSKAGAKGMWQFMHSTGKSYGLRIDSFVDERLDPVKSARAAAKYMKDAYGVFGDWNLAISSYNCGPGNVNKAIRRAGGKRDFWSIYPYLPAETRGYVPAFVGAMYAFNYYKEHGIKPVPTALPAHVDTFKITRMLHLRQVEDLVGVPLDMLRALNPQYIHDILPGDGEPNILRIPYSYTTAMVDAGDSLYTHKASEYLAPAIIRTLETFQDAGKTKSSGSARKQHTVKKGDTLSKIADKYKVSLSQLRKWNGMKDNVVKVGQKLWVSPPAKASSPAPAKASPGSKSKAKASPGSKSKAKPKPAATADKSAGSGNRTYTVKKGDTLFSIARTQGVDMAEIKHLNSMTDDQVNVGQTLVLPPAR